MREKLLVAAKRKHPGALLFHYRYWKADAIKDCLRTAEEYQNTSGFINHQINTSFNGVYLHQLFVIV